LSATASLDSPSCYTPRSAPLLRVPAAIVGTPVVGERLALDPGVFGDDIGGIDVQWQRESPVSS
jgi:hypothetical protein